MPPANTCVGSGSLKPAEGFMPLKAFNLFSTDWVIKARVVAKSDLRAWSNERGNG